jgi:uncharacterized membrane protein
MSTPYSEKSWYTRILGRSLMSILFGKFFESKNTTASIIAFLLVITLCYVIVFKEKYEYMNGVLNVVFVVIGYYFGAKQGTLKDEEDD